jgi:hypothetical protein
MPYRGGDDLQTLLNQYVATVRREMRKMKDTKAEINISRTKIKGLGTVITVAVAVAVAALSIRMLLYSPLLPLFTSPSSPIHLTHPQKAGS